MKIPLVRWQPMETIGSVMRPGLLVTLRVDGHPVVASWYTAPATDRSFWWNGDVTDDGDFIEILNPDGWAPIDLDAYRSHYERLIGAPGLPGLGS